MVFPLCFWILITRFTTVPMYLYILITSLYIINETMGPIHVQLKFGAMGLTSPFQQSRSTNDSPRMEGYLFYIFLVGNSIFIIQNTKQLNNVEKFIKLPL